MSYLFLLKRFEIWLLLGLVVALLVFAFQPIEEQASEEGAVPGGVVKVATDSGSGNEEADEAAAEPEPLVVQEVKVEPTEQGRIVELTLLARTTSEESVEVTEDTLKASTGTGMPVPHFFAPFRGKQSVTPGDPSPVTVTLWLVDSADSIWVDFQGERTKAELPGES